MMGTWRDETDLRCAYGRHRDSIARLFEAGVDASALPRAAARSLRAKAPPFGYLAPLGSSMNHTLTRLAQRFKLFGEGAFELLRRCGFLFGVTGTRHPQHSPGFF